ncbi:MAG: DUF2461 domain-containing protein [Bacteroidia bacterium]
MNAVKMLAFLAELKRHNTKEWFDAHREDYALIRKELIDYSARIIQGIGKFDQEILSLEPSKCIFRINRDVRFSSNKDPYKTNMGAYFNKNGKKAFTAGYYLHIEPGASFLAGGMYAPPSEVLAKVRQEIDYNFKDFHKIVTSSVFKDAFGTLEGEKLSRPPKGYTSDNEACEYLKHKSFLMVKKLNDSDFRKSDLDKNILHYFKRMHPLIKFLNNAVV